MVERLPKASFSVELDEPLYQLLLNKVNQEGRSVNDYINQLLNNNLQVEQSFEQRNLIGRRLTLKDIDPKSGLVQLLGNYYRYTLSGAVNVLAEQEYVVTQVEGNLLTIAAVVK
ncbi:hypothetical protein [Convivina intestini]|uniref:Toxin-antitoxin system HicB family antitoxin n=1 Tax=Convivina intestini TaxID=1505726 RepID=A0A2U1D484_9LACO|nr:hypothetical protein [Convivina intestini]PVY82362.1 hypothetical protein C7384_11318 [Convivina intestini]CAH1854553.1 hypothetical protein R078131_00976 [Convivina intestini]CAH1857378.1 hypothetical protein R077811_01481 [Convivina intestini]SDC14860.1 hypothetical protein SAMN05216341_11518 [Leuconostocaceae bacterium R-53105]